MIEIEKVLRYAMENDFVKKVDTKSFRKYPYFWLFHTLQDLLFQREPLDSILDTLIHGQEAVWRLDDPLPFFAFYYLQVPIILIQGIYRGYLWKNLDFSMEKSLFIYQ